MKRIFALILAISLLFAGCAAQKPELSLGGATEILLSDDGVTVDGKDATFDGTTSLIPAVYTKNDILYYPEGKDFTFGDAAEGEAHSAQAADAHTVVHITQPGTYRVSGTLSKGQIAVDLGERAKENPNAVVRLVLDGVDLTCTVAPAIIFYNVFECGSSDEENAQAVVNTEAAGANLYIADGSTNTVNGAYVARIYESYELSEDGTKVEDYETLHKYDGAVYSCMSMNVLGHGTLNINAENEGLDSELHLTVDGPTVNINSANDGINTNEDGVSVTTVNSGKLNITVNGKSGEGDGIDSNGWLVINGGSVTASACGTSGDAGIDSDLGIHLNGGTVTASGNMMDRIGESTSTYAVFHFTERQEGGKTYRLKDAGGNTVLEATPQNAFASLILSSPDLKAGTYTLWQGDTQLKTATGGFGGHGGGMGRGERPEDFDPEKMPKDFDPEKLPAPPSDLDPEKMPTPPDWKHPEGERPQSPYFSEKIIPNLEFTPELSIKDGENQFVVE
ncbi:MAG: carbohydrate-binding domain-containing protein [Oscillospiraceae bacterium]|nr:carbohydrate-binding domain-containing protein [Oscillospiraceae bacterium]